MNSENCVEIVAKGSSGNPYVVKFYLEENEIAAFCSCPAGGNRRLCKHVIRIMSGDNSILYDGSQKKAFVTIGHHLQKTTLPSLLSELNEAEIIRQDAERIVKRAKKAIEKAVLRR